MDQRRFDSIDALPWEKFGHWVYCICVVTFDLELGQSIEVVYPGNAQLTGTERSSICYLSFPDSNSGFVSDRNFHFRTRRSACDAQLKNIYEKYTENVAAGAGIDENYFHGFVHFRQKKDTSLPRGYLQKSLVVLTVLPIFDLFSLVVAIIANAFFELGEPAIEAACHHMDQWPFPVPGITLRLPLLGNVVQCRIPCQIEFYSQSTHQTVQVQESEVRCQLFAVTLGIGIGWRDILMIIVRFSPSTMLISVIFPPKRLRPNVILGVTNPYFMKVFQHWPHIIRLGDGEKYANMNCGKRKKTWNERILESKFGLFTQYKAYLQKDKSVFKEFCKIGRPQQGSVLQQHMIELTQNFMIPLENFMSSLLPLKKHLCPFKNAPQIQPFNKTDFLSTLDESRLTQISGIKGDWKGLYDKFFTSQNYRSWLERKKYDLEKQLRILHLEMLCNADFSKDALKERQQVEIVDLVLKLNDRINCLDKSAESARVRLQAQISAIMRSVDDDLKTVLLSNDTLRRLI